MTALDDADITWHRTVTHWGSYEAGVRGNRIVAMRPVATDPEPSDIGQSVVDALDGPSRVTAPMVRAGYLSRGPVLAENQRGAEPFREVSWDVALDLVARELERVHGSHGPAAMYGGSYGWASAGRFHHAQSQVHRFLGQLGGYTPSVGSYSFHAMEVIVPYVLGQSANEHLLDLPTWEEIAQHTELIVTFGGVPLKNSQVNPGGVFAHLAAGFQDRCRAMGVQFVNLSPVRDDVDQMLEAEWHAPRPNTDTAVLLALAHTIVSEGLQDEDFLQRCCEGFERFRRYLLGVDDNEVKDAKWAASISGLDVSVIDDLARRIATQRSLISVSWSIQRADHGEYAYWAAIALAAVAGQIGQLGGGVALGLGSHHATGTVQRKLPVAALPQQNDAAGVVEAIPVSRLADMLLNPGRSIDFDGRTVTFPDIRLVYWCGGNPFHHHQDLNRLVAAWQRPETIIVHEPFWTATARHADIVLPCTTPFERNDFARGRSEGAISAMQRVVAPPPGVKDDYEIFSALAKRLGFGERFTEGRSADGWVRHLYDQTRRSLADMGLVIPAFEQFWNEGHVEVPASPRTTIRRNGLRDLRRDPSGHPVGTPSGRIELFSSTIESFNYTDCPAHPAWIEPQEWLGSSLAARFPLHLLTPQPKTRLHSQYDHGATSRDSKVAGREPVRLNPSDAVARGVRDGDVVRLFNDRGACLAGAVLSESVRPGVVVLATGAWYDPVEPGVPGALDRHGNPNVLTLDKGTSSLAQASSAQTTLVEVELLDAEAPVVQCFRAPRTEV